MEWEPQFHLSSASAFRSAAALRHDDTSRIKTTLLSSQRKLAQCSSGKKRKSRTQKVGKSESEGPLAPSRTQTIFVQVIYCDGLRSFLAKTYLFQSRFVVAKSHLKVLGLRLTVLIQLVPYRFQMALLWLVRWLPWPCLRRANTRSALG